MNRRSILPNSSPHILTPLAHAVGILQVRYLPDIGDHGLFFNDSLIAIHNNGFSCRALAERILSAWEGKGAVPRVLEQLDYILKCGGLCKDRISVEWIANGCHEGMK